MIFQALPRIPVSLSAQNMERDFAFASAKADLRRQWVVRTTLALALTSIMIVGLIVLRADQDTINTILKSLDQRAVALQAEVNALGQLPAALPGDHRLRVIYVDSIAREYAKSTTAPVIVARTALAQPTIRANGRGVIFYENGRIRHTWLTAQEFDAAWEAQEAAISLWNLERRITAPILP